MDQCCSSGACLIPDQKYIFSPWRPYNVIHPKFLWEFLCTSGDIVFFSKEQLVVHRWDPKLGGKCKDSDRGNKALTINYHNN